MTSDTGQQRTGWEASLGIEDALRFAAARAANVDAVMMALPAYN